MKKLETSISPDKLGAVQQELLNCGISKIVFLYEKETRQVKSHPQFYRGFPVSPAYKTMVKLEIVVEDDLYRRAIAGIIKAARIKEAEDPIIMMTSIDYVKSDS